MKSFKLFFLFTSLVFTSFSQTFEEAKKTTDEAFVYGDINGTLDEGLPITYSKKGVVFLLTDASDNADSIWFNKPIKYLGISSKVLAKGKYIDDKFIASDVFTQSLMEDREVAEMATVFRKEGRIYVVVIVFSILMAGLIFYLLLLDRKVKKLEKE